MEDFVSCHFAGVSWCINSRYELKQRIGCGGHGVVVSAFDKSGQTSNVAIKKVVFDYSSHAYEAKRLLREVRLMRCLNHPNVISLIDIMMPSLNSHYSDSNKTYAFRDRLIDLYLVTELMSTDLQHVLAIANRAQSTFVLRPEQAQYLLYQLLCGMQYIGSAGVLHRDLKPSNLLVDLRSCQLRICDFGLARAIPKGVDSPGPRDPLLPLEADKTFPDDFGEIEPTNFKATMTEYVVTRWYRAPEILLGDVYYGPGIDVWSIGCILAEVLVPSIGVLFQGGERREMLALIIQMLGRPSEQELWFVSDNNAREFIQSLPPRPIETLSRRLSVGSPPLSAVSTPYPLLGTPHPPNYHRSLCCLPAAQLDPEVIDI